MTQPVMDEQTGILEMLLQTVKQNKVAHAYLFSGPGEAVKIRTALVWAKAILCTNQPGEGCDSCYSCRTLEEGNHPNWHMVEPDGTLIKIDQIRAMQKEFLSRAKDGGKKFFIIKSAEKMNQHAANSLLKWLEEPSSDLLIILLSASRMNLLPTIASRVQDVRFQPDTKERLIQRLQTSFPQLNEDTIRVIAAISEQEEDARTLAELESFAELHAKMIKWAQSLLVSPSHAILTYAETVNKSVDSSNVRLWIRLLMIFFRDLAMTSIGQTDRVTHRQLQGWLSSHARTKPVSVWLKRMDQAQAMLKKLSVNPSIQGMMDTFAFEEVSG